MTKKQTANIIATLNEAHEVMQNWNNRTLKRFHLYSIMDIVEMAARLNVEVAKAQEKFKRGGYQRVYTIDYPAPAGLESTPSAEQQGETING